MQPLDPARSSEDPRCAPNRVCWWRRSIPSARTIEFAQSVRTGGDSSAWRTELNTRAALVQRRDRKAEPGDPTLSTPPSPIPGPALSRVQGLSTELRDLGCTMSDCTGMQEISTRPCQLLRSTQRCTSGDEGGAWREG